MIGSNLFLRVLEAVKSKNKGARYSEDFLAASSHGGKRHMVPGQRRQEEEITGPNSSILRIPLL
jgi:hypothetical protein